MTDSGYPLKRRPQLKSPLCIINGFCICLPEYYPKNFLRKLSNGRYQPVTTVSACSLFQASLQDNRKCPGTNMMSDNLIDRDFVKK